MKHLYLIFIIFSLISCSKTKTENNVDNLSIDSLSIYVDKADNSNTSTKIRLENNDKVLHLLASKTNTQENRKKLFKVALNYYNLNDLGNFKKTSNFILEKAIIDKDTFHISKAYTYLGKYKADTSQNDSAYYYYTKAERLSLVKMDSITLGGIYINKAFIQLYENDYSGCELSCIKSLSFLKNSNELNKIYDAYNLIGISSNEMKNYTKAIEYHNKAIQLVRQNSLDDKNHLSANSLNNLAVVYQNLSKHQQAIINLNVALNDNNIFQDNPSLYSILIDNLAYSKLKIKDYKNLPNLFFQSLKIRDSLNLSSGIIINKIHLSEFYHELNNLPLSNKYAIEALHLAKTTKVSGDILSSLKQLSTVDITNSAFYSKEYIRISDSLQLSERNIKDKFARIAFETDEISLEKDKLEEQNRNLLYFFLGTLMIGVLLFVIRTQRAKNRELLLKQAQQKANEDIYNMMISQQNKIEEGRIAEKKRIAQELHDGVLGRLFGTRLNLDSLNKMITDEAILKRNKYLSELKNIEQDIREISHDLNREKYVLINNFIAILNNLLEEQKTSFDTGVQILIDENIKWEALNNNLKINLYRIIQESLQNINKYANANLIKIEIKKTVDSLVVSVVDNGDGFAVNKKKKGIGLQNMLSRANDSNGVFDIKSKKGKGTSIYVTFPIGNKEIITI